MGTSTMSPGLKHVWLKHAHMCGCKGVGVKRERKKPFCKVLRATWCQERGVWGRFCSSGSEEDSP